MGADIEEKVVQMRFDNKNFERNVSTTMSSLDKLKAKLRFEGVAKGFEDVSKAAKNVDLSSMGKSIEEVNVKFSSMQVVAVTALSRITNAAITAGTRIVSALTIDPVASGFSEYETQINAIQTILANTESKGSTLEDVNKALDELNKYADQTIYNFTEMTRNIGTFTAAGVDLETSVSSIKGIANLAAVSGSSALQASTAMYQLSQALAAGRVSLMDWNSVVNAGMGGELFQNALKRTARNLGYNVDAMIEKYGSFRESLTQGQWLTTEVLTETLMQLSGAYTEADLIAKGYTEEQAKEIVKLSETATDAATKVKTFTQLWDTLKEAAQSGWTQTWEIIIGDFEEARDFLTGISDMVGSFINDMSDARNSLLADAFSSSWKKISDEISVAGVDIEDFQERAISLGKEYGKVTDQMIEEAGSFEKSLKSGWLSSDIVSQILREYSTGLKGVTQSTEDMNAKLEYFQEVVHDVWMGDYKNGYERVTALTEAGYDYATVQDLVNKTIDGHKLTLEDLNVEQAANLGFTEAQVEQLGKLADQAKKTGEPLNKLINDLTKPSGRELLLGSFSMSLESILNVLRSIGQAWNEIFPPNPEGLYNAAKVLHSVAETLYIDEERTDKLRRTFKGLFAILDVVTTFISAPFKLAFKVLSTTLGLVNVDLLTFTATLGDMAVGIRNFILDNGLINTAFKLLGQGILFLIDALSKLFSAFMKLEKVQDVLEKVRSTISDFEQIGQDIIQGLQNGLEDGIESLPNVLATIGEKLLEAIKNVLGIHSPSTEMYEVGQFSIQGLVNGFMDGVSSVLNAVKGIGTAIINTFKSLNWKAIFAVGISIGLLYITKQLIDIVSAITAPLEGVGSVLSGVGTILDKAAKPISKVIKNFALIEKAFAGRIKADSFKIRAEGLKSIAIAIAILAASILLLSKVDSKKLWESVGAIGALAAIIGVLAFAVGKFSAGGTINFAGFALAVVGLSSSLLIMAQALKKLESIHVEKLGSSIAGLAVMITAIIGIMVAYGTLVKGKSAMNIGGLGTMLLKLSVALLIMVSVMRIIGSMSVGEMVKGGAAITAFVGIVAALSYVSTFAGKSVDKLGSTMIKISLAMVILVGVIKLVSGISVGDAIKGTLAINSFISAIMAIAFVTKFADKNISNFGKTVSGIALAMLSLVTVIRMVSGISVGEIAKGVAVITAFTGIIALMGGIVKMVGNSAPKISATLLSMSVSIAILAGVAILLSLIDVKGLINGLFAITVLGSVISMMVMATKNATDVKGNLVAMTVAIAVMATAIAALSFIDPKRLMTAAASLAAVMAAFSLMTVAAKGAKTSIVALGIMALAIAGLSFVLYKLSELNPESAMGSAIALSTVLLAISGVFAVLSIFGPMAAQAMIGAVALDAVIVVLGALVVGIGALVSKFPALQEFADKGVTLLETIGKGIGSFFGGIIGGFSAGVMSGLPEIGTYLSDFMTNLQPFLEGVNSIDPSSLSSVQTLVDMMLAITGANVLDSIASFFGFGTDSMEQFSEKIVAFGEAMADFGDKIKGKIDPASANSVSTIGKMFADLNESLPDGNIRLTELSSQIVDFGEAIVSFSDTIAPNGVSKVNEEAVNSASNAGKAIAELNKSLPKQGGALQSFLGSQDFSSFNSQMVGFGKAIVAFSDTIAPEGRLIVHTSAVESAANSGKVIAELNDALPRQGGALQSFLGAQDLGTFSSQMKSFGEAIVSFSNILSPDGSIAVNEDAIASAANAGMLIAELNDSLPKQGGTIQKFLGTGDLSYFGTQLVSFGKAMVDFSSIISADGAIDTTAVENTKSAAEMMAELTKSFPSNGGILSIFGGSDMEKFGMDLSAFGRYFASFYNSISEIDTEKAATVSAIISNMISALSSSGAINSEVVPALANAMETLGSVSINSFVDTVANSNEVMSEAADMMIASFIQSLQFNSENFVMSFTLMVDNALGAVQAKYETINLIGQAVASQFQDGILSKKEILILDFANLMSSIVNKITASYLSFKSAGSYVVSGFAAGITENTFIAEAAAAAMATAAYNAAMAAMDAHSPSRKFQTAGTYVPMGFANGILSKIGDVKTASDSMVNTALSGTKKAIARASEEIQNGIDMQPTIRPVLDLSSVETTAKKLDTLFSRSTAMSVSRSVESGRASKAESKPASVTNITNNEFVQNNNSPKSLSRVEIYRQTKNLFSASKGPVRSK